MDDALLAAYRASTYLVCIDAAQWAPIHVDEPLPEALQALVGEGDWGFITAWNPQSSPRSLAENTAAQQQLLASLRDQPQTSAIHPGVGIGANGWYEASLFVLGPTFNTLDALCRAHGQCAYVCGNGRDRAALRQLQDGASGSVSHGQPSCHCGQSSQ